MEFQSNFRCHKFLTFFSSFILRWIEHHLKGGKARTIANVYVYLLTFLKLQERRRSFHEKCFLVFILKQLKSPFLTSMWYQKSVRCVCLTQTKHIIKLPSELNHNGYQSTNYSLNNPRVLPRGRCLITQHRRHYPFHPSYTPNRFQHHRATHRKEEK